jgi:hypothetical protein
MTPTTVSAARREPATKLKLELEIHPGAGVAADPGGELSDDDLEAVVGGLARAHLPPPPRATT